METGSRVDSHSVYNDPSVHELSLFNPETGMVTDEECELIIEDMDAHGNRPLEHATATHTGEKPPTCTVFPLKEKIFGINLLIT